MNYEETYTSRYMYRRIRPIRKDYTGWIMLPLLLAMLLLPAMLGLN